MSGRVIVVGLGAGDPAQITPQVTQAINLATDIIGYIPYIDRITPKQGVTLHPSDNRVEIERVEHALALAQAGGIVLIVSSGDPGVFAMAAALFEALEKNLQNWQDIDIEILPGITAMLAAAALVGAPLGHDFCVINLSDNLKPWSIIEKRLLGAVEADFAMAFYNPRSKSRPEGFEKTLKLLQSQCEPDRLIIFARAVTTKEETVQIVPICNANAEMADMRTLVIVGSSQTRIIKQNKREWIYTPRSYPDTDIQ
jgi:precorrin-3B C17-methyltransferase